MVTNYYDTGCKVSESNPDRDRKQKRPLRQTTVDTWVIIKILLFVSFISDKIIEKFHSAPEKGLKIRSDEANYFGFELNRQKTAKATSLNICCSRASQLVTKNPPDRVVMLVLTSLLGVIFYHWVSKLTNLKNII